MIFVLLLSSLYPSVEFEFSLSPTITKKTENYNKILCDWRRQSRCDEKSFADWLWLLYDFSSSFLRTLFNFIVSWARWDGRQIERDLQFSFGCHWSKNWIKIMRTKYFCLSNRKFEIMMKQFVAINFQSNSHYDVLLRCNLSSCEMLQRLLIFNEIIDLFIFLKFLNPTAHCQITATQFSFTWSIKKQEKKVSGMNS